MLKMNRTLIPALFVCGAALWATGCSSTDLALSAPSGPKCQVAVDNSLGAVAAAGAAGTLTVTTTPECEWVATTATSWIALTSAPQGQGSGTVGYRVSANADPAVRAGTVAINTVQVPISQEAATCRFSVAPLSPTVSAAGGNLDIRVETSGSCTWQTSSQVSWIRLVSAANQTGSGTVTLAVEVNGGSARTGAVTIAGQTVTVTQAAAASVACTYSVSPTTADVPVTGGSVVVRITTAPTCAWQAASQVQWIVAAAPASGTGSGTVTLTVAASTTSSPRVGTVSVAGQTVTVTQAAAVAPCTFTISPTRADVARPGGIVAVTVTTAAGCAWTARPNAQWLSIASGAAGTGPGTVRVSVDRLGGSADERTGTVTIAGQTFRVNQER
jgi:hypothetical protein